MTQTLIPFAEWTKKFSIPTEFTNYVDFAASLAMKANDEQQAYEMIMDFMGFADDTPPEPKPTAKPKVNAVNKDNDALTVLANALSPLLNIPEQNVEIDEGKVIELIKQYAPVKHIEIHKSDSVSVVSGVQHCMFEKVLQRLNAGLHLYLYGGAGTGKTKMAENVANALGLGFYAISVCAQSSKTDLLGYMSATGEYCGTLFRQAYEHGGVFLIDEVDNGNPNILAVLNAALAGSYCAFPDGMIKRHENFRCIAAANTFGYGASMQYVGRVKLDESTKDRFHSMLIDYDVTLERALFGDDLADRIVKLRTKYANERVVISMRAYERVIKLMSIGLTIDEAIQEGIIENIPTNIRK